MNVRRTRFASKNVPDISPVLVLIVTASGLVMVCLVGFVITFVAPNPWLVELIVIVMVPEFAGVTSLW